MAVVKRHAYASTTLIRRATQIEIVNFVGGGRTQISMESESLVIAGREFGSRLHHRHRQVPHPPDHGRGARGVRRRHGHGRGAPREHHATAARNRCSTTSTAKRIFLLPNTAACYTADDAIRTARLGREVGLSQLGEARGHRRREDALPRQRSAARGDARAREGRLRRPALHQRRSGDVPQAARTRAPRR